MVKFSEHRKNMNIGGFYMPAMATGEYRQLFRPHQKQPYDYDLGKPAQMPKPTLGNRYTARFVDTTRR